MKREESDAEGNGSMVEEFILLGFSDLPELQGLLSVVLVTMYITILVGNSLLIIITMFDPVLQKPMYFFLANLSSLEICYVSVTLPKILANIWTQDRRISLLGCATQMYFFLILAGNESLLLAVMSYDRYVAICHPLRYPMLMNTTKCVWLAAGALLSGLPVPTGLTCTIFSLNFCKSNHINHYFCDVRPVLTLACGDTSVPELSIYAAFMVFADVPFMLILASYSKILSSILRFPTAQGRGKAFSTCSSHLMAVLLFYGSASITYLRPKSSHSAELDKWLSLFYIVVTPMLNPMIYSLRNREVIEALRKLLP
ncbi:olfactory receptor 10AG1-like [Perognathus longimembris pacificus]|uniref:olfactory receptor 10AG1-like n=1 Tax=Perognathus longimembris pacificus TaxID=214514 RepID=UPI0020196C64|nr:olfactory receptor 10AG1-like [Perognathus longimembris pacificus]